MSKYTSEEILDRLTIDFSDGGGISGLAALRHKVMEYGFAEAGYNKAISEINTLLQEVKDRESLEVFKKGLKKYMKKIEMPLSFSSEFFRVSFSRS